MHKINLGTLIAGIVKSNFKGTNLGLTDKKFKKLRYQYTVARPTE